MAEKEKLHISSSFDVQKISENIAQDSSLGSKEDVKEVEQKTRSEVREKLQGEPRTEEDRLKRNKGRAYDVAVDMHEKTLLICNEKKVNTMVKNVLDTIVEKTDIKSRIEPKIITSHDINAFVYTHDAIEDIPDESSVNTLPVYINTGCIYYMSEHYRKKRELVLKKIFPQKRNIKDLSYVDSYEDLMDIMKDENISKEDTLKLKEFYRNDKYFLTEDKIAAIFSHELTHLKQEFRIHDYSKQEMEYDADAGALKLLDSAGYAPEAMEEVLTFLEYLTKNEAFSPFGSHPSPKLRKKEIQLAYFDLRSVFLHAGQSQKRVNTLDESFKNEYVRRTDHVLDRIFEAKNSGEIIEMVKKIENVDEYFTAMQSVNMIVNYNLAYKEVQDNPKHLQDFLTYLKKTEVAYKNFLDNAPPYVLEKTLEYVKEHFQPEVNKSTLDFLEKNMKTLFEKDIFDFEKISEMFGKEFEMLDKNAQKDLELMLKRFQIFQGSDHEYIKNNYVYLDKKAKSYLQMNNWYQKNGDESGFIHRVGTSRERTVFDGKFLEDLITGEFKPHQLYEKNIDKDPISTSDLCTGWLKYLDSHSENPDISVVEGNHKFTKTDEENLKKYLIENMSDRIQSSEKDNDVFLQRISKIIDVLKKEYDSKDDEINSSFERDKERMINNKKNKDLCPYDFQHFTPEKLNTHKALSDLILKRYAVTQYNQINNGTKEIPLLKEVYEQGRKLMYTMTNKYKNTYGYDEITEVFIQSSLNIFDTHKKPELAVFMEKFFQRKELLSLDNKEKEDILDLMDILYTVYNSSHRFRRNDELKYSRYNLGKERDTEYLNFKDYLKNYYVSIEYIERKQIESSNLSEAIFSALHEKALSNYYLSLGSKSLNSLKKDIQTSYLKSLEILEYIDDHFGRFFNKTVLKDLAELAFRTHFRSTYETFTQGKFKLNRNILDLHNLDMEAKLSILENNFPESSALEIADYFNAYEIRKKIIEDPKKAAKDIFALLHHCPNKFTSFTSSDATESSIHRVLESNKDISTALFRILYILTEKDTTKTDQPNGQQMSDFIQTLSTLSGLTLEEKDDSYLEWLEDLKSSKLMNPDKTLVNYEELNELLKVFTLESAYPIDVKFNGEDDIFVFMSPKTKEFYYNKLKKYYLDSENEIERTTRKAEVEKQLKNYINDRFFFHLDSSKDKKYYKNFQKNRKQFFVYSLSEKDIMSLLFPEKRINIRECEYITKNIQKFNVDTDTMKLNDFSSFADYFLNELAFKKGLMEYPSGISHARDMIKNGDFQKSPPIIDGIEILYKEISSIYEGNKKIYEKYDLLLPKMRALKKETDRLPQEMFIIKNITHNLIQFLNKNYNSLQIFSQLFSKDILLPQYMFKILNEVYGGHGQKKEVPDEIINVLGDDFFNIPGMEINLLELRKIYQDNNMSVPQELDVAISKIRHPEQFVVGNYDYSLREIISDMQKTISDGLKIYVKKHFLSSYKGYAAVPLVQSLLYKAYGEFGEKNTIPEELQKYFGKDFHKFEGEAFINNLNIENILETLKKGYGEIPYELYDIQESNDLYYRLHTLGVHVDFSEGMKLESMDNEKNKTFQLFGGRVDSSFHPDRVGYINNSKKYIDVSDLELLYRYDTFHAYSAQLYCDQFEKVLNTTLKENNSFKEKMDTFNDIYAFPHDVKDIYLGSLFNQEICNILKIEPSINTFDYTENLKAFNENQKNKEPINIIPKLTKVSIPFESLKNIKITEEQLEKLYALGEIAQKELRSSSPQFLYLLGRMLYELWQNMYTKEELSSMFDESLQRLNKYIPVPSYHKNDYLDEIISRSSLSESEKNKVIHLFYSKERREKLGEREQKEDVAIWGAEAKLEDIRQNLRNLSQSSKSDYLLWLLSDSYHSENLIRDGSFLHCKFDSFKKVFHTETPSMKKHILVDLCMSGKGIFETSSVEELKEMRKFLDTLFDIIVSENNVIFNTKKDKNMFKKLFVNIFESFNKSGEEFEFNAIRPTELLTNIMFEMDRLKKENIPIDFPTLMKVFMSQFGIVGAKLSQVLSESDMVENEEIKDTLRGFKEGGAEFSKIAALSILENNNMYFTEETDELKVTSLGKNIANASIKGVFNIETNKSEQYIAKFLNYSGTKRYKQDIEAIKYLAKLSPEFKIPDTLVSEIESLCYEEIDFRNEYENQKVLFNNNQLRPESMRYVQVVLADYASSDLMIEKKVRGVSLSDIQILKEDLSLRDERGKQDLLKSQEKIRNKIQAEYTENFDTLLNLINDLNLKDINDYLSKEIFLQIQERAMHTDLHSGNIFLDIEKLLTNRLDDLVEKGESPLYLIDCGRAYSSEKDGFDLEPFIIHTYNQDSTQLTKLFISSFLEESSTIDAKQLKKDITEILSPGVDISENIQRLLWGLVNKGYVLNKNFKHLMMGLATGYPLIKDNITSEILKHATFYEKVVLGKSYLKNLVFANFNKLSTTTRNIFEKNVEKIKDTRNTMKSVLTF